MAGLRTNQAALSIVSSNVANAQTPGYVTRTLDQSEVAGSSSDTGASVRDVGVSRQINLFLQSQLRTETSGSAYADQMSKSASPASMGRRAAPERSRSHNNFTSALQALSANSRLVRSIPGPGDRAIAGAAAEYHDAGSSAAAFECGAGHWGFGHSGQ
jgi:flagellar hook-associated protein 1 FlgK